MDEAVIDTRVVDPFGIPGDPGFPGIAQALDPAAMARRFETELRRLGRGGAAIELQAIRVVRHKPGRRCLIEYDLLVSRPGERADAVTLIGKVRAGHSPKEAFRLLHKFWHAGFHSASPDGISVPKPIGCFADLGLSFQRKVDGQPASALLSAPGAAALMTRIAEAVHKIHAANVPTERSHTIADELRILREHLPRVALRSPSWQRRIERLLVACERLGASVPAPTLRGIHRDCYADQVVVAGERLTVIDFDLYCRGDIGVDIGNFLGHLIEQALRDTGDPAAYSALEAALSERFFALAGSAARASVAAYTDLTLVRQIYLSTLLEARRRLTGELLALCEGRLAAWL